MYMIMYKHNIYIYTYMCGYIFIHHKFFQVTCWKLCQKLGVRMLDYLRQHAICTPMWPPAMEHHPIFP